MKLSHSFVRHLVLPLVLATSLGGCAYTGYSSGHSPSYSAGYGYSSGYPSSYPPAHYPGQAYPASPYQYSSHGVIDSIQRVDRAAAQGIGAGTIIGGIVGGLLGNRIGGGDGKKIAIATGAVGGALIGNQIEQQNGTALPMYQIGVRMENGGFQTFTQDSVAGLGIGTQVRIDNGRIYRY